MIRFGKKVFGRARWGGLMSKPRGHVVRKLLICLVLACVIFSGSVSLAQAGSRPADPPRPKPTTLVWPWFVAFILLGLGCAPAFKNSKRELER